MPEIKLLQNGKYFIENFLNETDLDCTYTAIDLIKNRPVAIAQFKLDLMANFIKIEGWFSLN